MVLHFVIARRTNGVPKQSRAKKREIALPLIESGARNDEKGRRARPLIKTLRGKASALLIKQT